MQAGSAEEALPNPEAGHVAIPRPPFALGPSMRPNPEAGHVAIPRPPFALGPSMRPNPEAGHAAIPRRQATKAMKIKETRKRSEASTAGLGAP